VGENLLNIKATSYNQSTTTNHHTPFYCLLAQQHSSSTLSGNEAKNVYSLRITFEKILIYSEVTLDVKHHILLHVKIVV